jgi:hypothetical protein
MFDQFYYEIHNLDSKTQEPPIFIAKLFHTSSKSHIHRYAAGTEQKWRERKENHVK